MKVLSVEFVTSAPNAAGIPRDGVPQIALVGRSNVGKSSLINALTRRKVARTSAAPGKTRLANVYRVALPATGPGALRALYLVDLPGYGYARGGDAAREEFAALAEAYFGGAEGRDERLGGARGQGARLGAPRDAALRWLGKGEEGSPPDHPTGSEGVGHSGTVKEAAPSGGAKHAAPISIAGIVLAMDGRHPGLENDLASYAWVQTLGLPSIVVTTKVDRMSRADRDRTRRQFENSLRCSVLPVSAVTGEGLEDLWKQIRTVASSPPPK